MDTEEFNFTSVNGSAKNRDQDEGKRLNKEQKVILVEFLEKHPELKSGKFSATFTKKISTKLWMEVATLLNSIPCASKKSHDQWRKVSFDLNSEINKH